MRSHSVVLLCLAASVLIGTAPAFAGNPAYEQDLINRVTMAFGAGIRPEPVPEPGPHRRCGSPLLLEVRIAWPELSESARQAISVQVQTTRPQLSEYYDTQDGRFRLHFNRTGPDSIDMVYGVGPGNVPVYILKCDSLLQRTVAEEIDTLGFRFPISDAIGRSGEDPRYDIYFFKFSGYMADYYGLSEPDTVYFNTTSGTYVASSWIALRSEYSSLYGYATRPFDAMAVTIAHELNHACQWSYDALEAEARRSGSDDLPTLYPWWLEVTAVAMEDIVFDNVNDYVAYLPAFFNNPWMSLRAYANNSGPEGLHPYASGIWALFLAQRHDPVILREIWEECGQKSGFNTFEAFRTALERSPYNSSLDVEWAAFLVWNYFTGRNWAPWSYEEGRDYPELAGLDSVVYSEYPAGDTSSILHWPRSPDEEAASYLRFVPVYSDTVTTFTLQLFPEGIEEWMVVTAGINGTAQPTINFTRSVFDPIRVEHWDAYEELLVIVSPFKLDPTQDRLDRRLRFSFAVQDTLVDNRVTSIHKVYSNPLVLADEGGGDAFRVQVLRAESVPVSMHIFTLAGQVIRGGAEDDMYRSPGRTAVTLSWDGTNRQSRRVASGVYLALIQYGDKREVVKVAVKNYGP
ncbi:MAG: MXAN_6640 family putative metalloprotease [Candidatus Zixiibacteriota bacterium]